MTVVWIVASIALIALWAITIFDVVRRHYPGTTTIGWIALVVFLPFVGALIYWATRKPTSHEVEEQYLGEAELRRSSTGRPFDSTGL
jgi:hypothetical protein